MTIAVRESTIEEIEKKLASFATALNKISYLESVIKSGSFDLETKRHIWHSLAKLYEERKMFESAAKAFAHRASLDITFKDRSNNYISSAELFCKAGNVSGADDMFVRALRECIDGKELHRESILLARKNVFLVSARELESKGKRATALKFYEKLLTLPDLDVTEKSDVKERLLASYKALGMFREARLLEKK